MAIIIKSSIHQRDIAIETVEKKKDLKILELG